MQALLRRWQDLDIPDRSLVRNCSVKYCSRGLKNYQHYHPKFLMPLQYHIPHVYFNVMLVIAKSSKRTTTQHHHQRTPPPLPPPPPSPRHPPHPHPQSQPRRHRRRHHHRHQHHHQHHHHHHTTADTKLCLPDVL